MSWEQTTIVLPTKSRGCHLVTKEIEGRVPQLRTYSVGLANIFCKLRDGQLGSSTVMYSLTDYVLYYHVIP